MGIGYAELLAIGEIAAAERLLHEAMGHIDNVAHSTLLSESAQLAAQIVWDGLRDTRTEALPAVARTISRGVNA